MGEKWRKYLAKCSLQTILKNAGIMSNLNYQTSQVL
jgi:hypothetical protein